MIQHPVQALNKRGWIAQRHAFKQKRLVEEQPSGVFHPAVVVIREELLDDLVIGIDL